MFDFALKDAVTNSITIKSGEVAETFVTNTLRAQFVKEIDHHRLAAIR